MRHHGWELPYHPLQVLGIAAFFALGFAFYVFFAPFSGNKVSRLHFMVLYSPLELAVLILYIQCAAANPADPGILRSYRLLDQHKTSSSVHRCAKSRDDARGKELEQGDGADTQRHILGKKEDGGSVEPIDRPAEDLLFCTLCNVEVYKSSKHCRACNKCVNGFDHHCRWLNNCVGRKNYKTFIALMVSTLLSLTIQWTVGVLVLVRCFLHWKGLDDEVIRNLGSSFTMIPLVVIVGICTSLAMIAAVTLSQLFLFHMILIKRGITTYDYVVAIRQEAQGQHVYNGQSELSSPSISSSTSSSGFLGTLQKGAACFSPQDFEDQESVTTSVAASVSGFDSTISRVTKLGTPQVGTKFKQPGEVSSWRVAQGKKYDAPRELAISLNSSILHHVEGEKEALSVKEAQMIHEDVLYKASRKQASDPSTSGVASKNRTRNNDGQLDAMIDGHAKISVMRGKAQKTIRPDMLSVNREIHMPSMKGLLCSYPLVDASASHSSHMSQGGTSSCLVLSGDGPEILKKNDF